MEEKKKQEEKKEELPVRLLERKLRYKGSVLEVYEDTVDVSGHVTHWDFIHHMGAAAVLPVLEDGRLLMVRQYRHALSRFKRKTFFFVQRGSWRRKRAIRVRL